MQFTVDKNELIQLFISTLELDLNFLIESTKAIRDEATHEESKPENEYDTRAIESGYMVKAQSKRILDAKEMLAEFRNMQVRTFKKGDPIASSALIQVLINNQSKWFLYMSKGGGLTVQYKGQTVQVITPSSPLGESLLGLSQGDFAVVEAEGSSQQIKEFEILQVL